ncbi:hypothetical protein SynBIOSE41_02396 [Synechococcus sp. BIOS-E4-1]|nr:hypothetical protein SynBIOSE41_02396 [Synechococcus sp. BIOS-E4-1]
MSAAAEKTTWHSVSRSETQLPSSICPLQALMEFHTFRSSSKDPGFP